MNIKKAVISLIWFILVPFPLAYIIPGLIDLIDSGKFHVPAPLIWFGLLISIIGTSVLLFCFYNFVKSGVGSPAVFDQPKKLLSSNIYSYSRNPMYVSVIMIISGQILWYGNLLILGYGIVLGLALHMWIMFYEEPRLIKRFGKPYEDYKSKIPRWIGLISRR